MKKLLFVFLFLIFVPVVVIISFVAKYAICYVVIKGYSLKKALAKAWKLFLDNWIISLEMSLTLLLLSFGVSLALFFAFFPI